MCKCCEEINFLQNDAIKPDYIEDKLFANISVYSWRKGTRKLKQYAQGIYTSKAYKLNYCPECGKKIGR